MKQQKGFTIVHVLVLVLVVGVIAGVGWRVIHRQTKKSVTTSNTTQTQTTASQTSGSSPSPMTSKSTEALGDMADDTPQPSFRFVDTNGWQVLKPTDSSYSVKFGSSGTYGQCNNNASALLLGMIYMNGSTNSYDCGKLSDAVSPHTLNGSTLLLTRIAFGRAETLWDRGQAVPVAVTLSNGDSATRYFYTHMFDGKLYNTVEYRTTHNSTEYMAVMNWDAGYDLNSGSGISIDMFDTIVQKTLSYTK